MICRSERPDGISPYLSIAQDGLGATRRGNDSVVGELLRLTRADLTQRYEDANVIVRAPSGMKIRLLTSASTRLTFFDGGVGVVAVDAFVVLGFDFIPRDIAMGVEFFGDATDEVFDENGIFVSAFGDGFFVTTFEQGIQFTTGACFDESDQVLNPNRFPRTNLDGAKAALIVRSVFGNCLGAGAERGDTDFDGEHEIDVFGAGGGIEARGVIHHAFHSRDGRFFGEEKWEFHFQMRSSGVELRLHGVENVVDVFDVDHAAVGVEHLDEAAHVGAFELVGQVDKHADGRDCVLHDFFFVADLNRETQATNADFVDAQFAMVALALFVVHDLNLGIVFRRCAHGP